MKALLQLQWSMHKSSLFLCISIIAILGYFFHDMASEMSLVTFALAFSINNASISREIFTNNNSQLLLYTLPIERSALIQNLYITSFFYCTVVYLLILPIQIYSGLAHQDLASYMTTIAGFYGVSLISSAFNLSHQLQYLKKESTLNSLLSLGAALFVVLIPHMFLSFISHEPSFYLRLLFMPTFSVLLYCYLTKRGIKKFSNRELL